MSQSKKNSRQRKQPQTGDPKRWLWPVLAGIVIVVILGLVIFSQVGNQNRTAAGTATSYPLEVSLNEAVAKRDAGAFMLDVRTQSEWNEYHVPGSTLIPLDTLASRLNELPRDKEIIVVCRSGNRSAQGRDILRNAGFTTVTSLAGGLSNWKAQGFPTVSGQP
jgi:rhodanese-related sulfurtransferase